MITGDHPRTGAAVARAPGIEGAATSGRELDRVDEDDLARRMPELGVLARVAPEHELRAVDALRRRGRVVARLGDGVNDAPALKRADIRYQRVGRDPTHCATAGLAGRARGTPRA